MARTGSRELPARCRSSTPPGRGLPVFARRRGWRAGWVRPSGSRRGARTGRARGPVLVEDDQLPSLLGYDAPPRELADERELVSRLLGRRRAAHRLLLGERRPDRAYHERVGRAPPTQPHGALGRVHVHVYLTWPQLQPQEGRRMTPLGQQIGVSPS